MFYFDESFFLTGAISDSELNGDDIEFIKNVRPFYPELAHWSNAGVYIAWGAYSSDIYATGWADWIRTKDNGFLAYC